LPLLLQIVERVVDENLAGFQKAIERAAGFKSKETAKLSLAEMPAPRLLDCERFQCVTVQLAAPPPPFRRVAAKLLDAR